MNLACGLIGPNFFSNGDFYGYPRQIVPITFVVGGSGLALLRQLYSTTVTTSSNVAHALTSPAALWTQFACLFAVSTAWFVATQDVMHGFDRILLLCSIGLLNAAQTVTIIVAHMARTEVSSWNYARLAPLLLAVANTRLQIVNAPPTPKRKPYHLCTSFQA